MLEEVQPQDDNRLVVNMFVDRLYGYSLSSTCVVRTLAFDSVKLLYPVVFVVDAYWCKQRIGLTARIKDIPDVNEIHYELRYFAVKGFSVYFRTQHIGRKGTDT